MTGCCKRWIVVLIQTMYIVCASTIWGQSVTPEVAKHGMVVSTDRFATQAGLEILKKGGNAIDAAAATAFAMAVTYPSCGNMGGEGVLLFYGANGIVSVIDFRVQAPASYSVPLQNWTGDMRHYKGTLASQGERCRSKSSILVGR